MSEGSATGMDPRFDPRFQRGYSHEVTEVPDAVVAPDPASTDAAALPPHDDAATAPAPAPAAPQVPARPVVAPAVDPDLPADAGERASTDVADPFDVEAPDSALSPSRWLWIALAVCAAFVIVGATAFWLQASDPSNYIGGVRAGLDETVRLVINTLAPALVQAGMVGIVVVLVTWAITGRRSSTGEEHP